MIGKLGSMFLLAPLLLLATTCQAQMLDVSLPQGGPPVVGWVQEADGPATLKEASGNTRPAQVQAEVLAEDTVLTGPGGRVQLIFTDQTLLALGENSELVVRDAMDLDGGGAFDLQFVSGAARVVTSKVVTANPDKFKLSTPLGSIGIRGTEFGSLVEGGREVHLLYNGGPVLYSDQQYLSADQAEIMGEACRKLATARYLTEQVYYNVGPSQFQLKGEMKDQLTEIKAMQEQYRCDLLEQ